jgi:hypothetical protein
VSLSRLRSIFYDRQNTRERERLLRDLGLPVMRPETLDLADRIDLDRKVFQEVERRFGLYEVERNAPSGFKDPDSPFPPAKPSAPTHDWIGLWLIDQSGKPVPYRRYRLVTPDKQTLTGTLDSEGHALVQRLKPGDCQVSCPDIEPHGSLTYSVQEGDHASSIALEYGYDDYTAVWSRSENAGLRAQRPYGHELVPGDQVFVPALPATQPVSKPTGDDHVFVIRLSPFKLRLQLLGPTLKPRAALACTVDGAPLTADGQGIVERVIDKTASACVLKIDDLELPLLIGRLHPSTDDGGWRARLYNLGFMLDPNAEDGGDEMTIAVEDFQAEYDLPVTGVLDDAAKAKLQDVYGC